MIAQEKVLHFIISEVEVKWIGLERGESRMTVTGQDYSG